MNHKPITAILYSEEDALRFLKERPKVERVFPLTPNARAALLELDLPILSTTDIYTDYQQRKVLARIRRMERVFLKILREEEKLSLAAKETLRAEVHVLASTSISLWILLKDTGPWLFPDHSGWLFIPDHQTAHQYLLKHLKPQTRKRFLTLGKPPCASVVRGLNYLIAWIWRKYPLVCVNDYSYGLGGLMEQMAKSSPLRSLSISGTKGSWKDIKQTFISLKNTLQNRKIGALLVVPEPLPQTAFVTKRAISSITDNAVLNGINVFREDLVTAIVLLDGLHKDMRAFIDLLKPKRIVACQLRWYSAAVLGEVGQEYEVPRLLISHGSHPVPDSTPAAFEHMENAKGLLLSPLTDEILLQSPHAAANVAQINLDSIIARRSHPVMWAYSDLPVKKKMDGMRCILHAGTYKGSFARPWIYETTDEFVKGLVSLVLATQSFENTKLIIRFRPTPECSVSSLEKLLPKSGHYEIKTSGTFLEDLAAADLLVSFSSTTIEEALHARCPVLLWGGSLRYRHLPARTKYPTIEDRSAAYTPATEKDLPSMLLAILDAHTGHPLTNVELEKHVWPSSVPGRDELIHQLTLCN